MINSFEVKGNDRLDKTIAKELNISRSQIDRLISKGFVHINGENSTKKGLKVQIGDIISYDVLEVEKKESYKEIDFEIEILYEDEYILVVNKPSGLVVHPAPSVKEATLVDWLIKKGVSLSTISGEERHGIVHRIDKETTGALIVAKTNKAHENLSLQLQDKSMGRYYISLIDLPLKKDMIINKAIGRKTNNRFLMTIREDGKEAKTKFVKLLEKEKIELIGAKLFTGRTHQIRVHLQSIGRHILGDEMYGFKSKKERLRVQLHAYLLYFIHPITEKYMEIKAPIFEDMQELLEKYFTKEKINVTLNSENFKNYFQ